MRYFPKNIVFLFLKISFVSENSAGPDEMQHYGVFHLAKMGLFCLSKYPFRDFWSIKG